MTKTGINLGCGELLRGDHLINVDMRQTSIVEIIVDLEQTPWPFCDDWAEEIHAIDVLEHLVKAMPAIEECWRILKVGGKMFVRTGNWQMENAFSSWEHHHFPTLKSFDVFDPSTECGQKYAWYSKAKFKILRAEESGQELEFDLEKLP